METKKSIVRSAIFKKTGNGTNGEYHIFEITFDNGDKGDFITKKNPQSSFAEGKETEYTIETVVNGNYTNHKIKPVQNGFVPGKGNPAYEHKRTALKCATDLVCAGKIEEKNLIPAAEKLMKFLNE
jgi:hypothetical protein